MMKNDIFSTSTQVLESVFVPARAHYLNICRRLTSRPSNSIFGFLKFIFAILERKKHDFAEFKVHASYS